MIAENMLSCVRGSLEWSRYAFSQRARQTT